MPIYREKAINPTVDTTIRKPLHRVVRSSEKLKFNIPIVVVNDTQFRPDPSTFIWNKILDERMKTSLKMGCNNTPTKQLHHLKFHNCKIKLPHPNGLINSTENTQRGKLQILQPQNNCNNIILKTKTHGSKTIEIIPRLTVKPLYTHSLVPMSRNSAISCWNEHSKHSYRNNLTNFHF